MKQKDIETIPINEDLLRLITPQGIEMKPMKCQIGENLAKIQYISGYPSSVNLGWLSNLKDIPNTTCTLLVTPQEDVQAYVEGISKRNDSR